MRTNNQYAEIGTLKGSYNLLKRAVSPLKLSIEMMKHQPGDGFDIGSTVFSLNRKLMGILSLPWTIAATAVMLPLITPLIILNTVITPFVFLGKLVASVFVGKSKDGDNYSGKQEGSSEPKPTTKIKDDDCIRGARPVYTHLYQQAKFDQQDMPQAEERRSSSFASMR